MNCPVCNSELKENENLCPFCGEIIAKRERGSINFPVNPKAKTLSVGSFMLMILAGMISPLNVILYLIWAFSPNTNINRKNFARAMLLLWLIAIVLAVGSFFVLNNFLKFHFDFTNIIL